MHNSHTGHGKGSGKKRKNMPGYHYGTDSIGRHAWLAIETVKATHDRESYLSTHMKVGDIIGLSKGVNATVLGKHKDMAVIFDPTTLHVRMTGFKKNSTIVLRDTIDVFKQFPHLADRKIMGSDLFVKDLHQPAAKAEPEQVPLTAPHSIGDVVNLSTYHPHAVVGDVLINSNDSRWSVIGVTKDYLVVQSDKIHYPYAIKVSDKHSYKIAALGKETEPGLDKLHKKIMAASKFVDVPSSPGQKHTMLSFMTQDGGHVIAPHMQGGNTIQIVPQPKPLSPAATKVEPKAIEPVKSTPAKQGQDFAVTTTSSDLNTTNWPATPSGEGGTSSWKTAPDGQSYLVKKNEAKKGTIVPSAVAELFSSGLGQLVGAPVNKVKPALDNGVWHSVHNGAKGTVEDFHFDKHAQLLEHPDMFRLHALDMFLVNIDRHTGTLKVDKDGKLLAVDQSYLGDPMKHPPGAEKFLERVSEGKYPAVSSAFKALKGKTLSKESRQAALDTWSKLASLSDNEITHLVDSIPTDLFSAGELNVQKASLVKHFQNRRDYFQKVYEAIVGSPAVSKQEPSVVTSLSPTASKASQASSYASVNSLPNDLQHVYSLDQAVKDVVANPHNVMAIGHNGYTVLVAAKSIDITNALPGLKVDGVSKHVVSADADKQATIANIRKILGDAKPFTTDQEMADYMASHPYVLSSVVSNSHYNSSSTIVASGNETRTLFFGKSKELLAQIGPGKITELGPGLDGQMVYGSFYSHTGKKKFDYKYDLAGTHKEAFYAVVKHSPDLNTAPTQSLSPSQAEELVAGLTNSKPPAPSPASVVQNPSKGFVVKKLDSQSIKETFNYNAGGTATIMADNAIEDQMVRTVAIHNSKGKFLHFESTFRRLDIAKGAYAETFFQTQGKDISNELRKLTKVDLEGRLYQRSTTETWVKSLTGSNDAKTQVYSYTTAGGTEIIYVKSNKVSLNGLTLVKSLNEESLESNVHDSLALLGFKSDYATPKDLQKMKWRKAAFAAMTHKEFLNHESSSPEAIEDFLRKKYNVSKILDDDVHYVADGVFAPTFSKEFFDKVIAPNVKDVYHQASMRASLPHLTKGGGLVATLGRFTHGLTVKGMSSVADIGTGGAGYIFTRLSRYKDKLEVGSNFSNSASDNKIHIVIRYNPEILRRTDHYSYSSDAFGVKDPKAIAKSGAYRAQYESRVPSWEVSKNTSAHSGIASRGTSNETMFKYGTDINQMDEILITHRNDGDHLKDALHMYNGIPPELKGKLKVTLLKVDGSKIVTKTTLDDSSFHEIYKTLSPAARKGFDKLPPIPNSVQQIGQGLTSTSAQTPFIVTHKPTSSSERQEISNNGQVAGYISQNKLTGKWHVSSPIDKQWDFEFNDYNQAVQFITPAA